jgi:uncharacterized alkaline shock family protein YloU
MAKTEGRTLPSELGTVKIADEVVSIIAGLAATEVEGVASMSGGIDRWYLRSSWSQELLQRVSRSKWAPKKQKLIFFLPLNTESGFPTLPGIFRRSVKKAIEKMTGLTVSSVNIHVQGVQFPTERK